MGVADRSLLRHARVPRIHETAHDPTTRSWRAQSRQYLAGTPKQECEYHSIGTSAVMTTRYFDKSKRNEQKSARWKELDSFHAAFGLSFYKVRNTREE